MPKRVYKSKEKIDSSEVQGADSWVLIRRPTWDDFEHALNGNSSDGELDQMQVGRKVIENLVEGWNWVDDDDNPLPPPTPELIRSLPFQEINFLIQKIDLADLTEKN